MWRDGLFPTLLRKFCIQQSDPSVDLQAQPIMKMLQLDGDVSL